jgi:integrase
MSAGLSTAAKPSWADVRHVGRVLQERIGGRVRWRLDFGWQAGHRIRIHADRSPVTGRPRPFESRAHAETVLSEIRAAVLDGHPLDRVLDRMRGRTPAEDLVVTRLAAYARDFERSVEQGRRSPNSLRELARYAREGGHFSWWAGRSVDEITTPNLREFVLWLGDRLNQRTGERLAPKAQKNVIDLFRAFVRRLADDGVITKAPKFPSIQVPEVVIQAIDTAEQDRVLAAIEWDRRGAFLACAREALRPSEGRAADLDDFDPEKGTLRVDKAVQGARLDARVAHTKNRTAPLKEVWDPQLRDWLVWRPQHRKALDRLGPGAGVEESMRPGRRRLPAAAAGHEALDPHDAGPDVARADAAGVQSPQGLALARPLLEAARHARRPRARLPWSLFGPGGAERRRGRGE